MPPDEISERSFASTQKFFSDFNKGSCAIARQCGASARRAPGSPKIRVACLIVQPINPAGERIGAGYVGPSRIDEPTPKFRHRLFGTPDSVTYERNDCVAQRRPLRGGPSDARFLSFLLRRPSPFCSLCLEPATEFALFDYKASPLKQQQEVAVAVACL
jgi:hypothetical protein